MKEASIIFTIAFFAITKLPGQTNGLNNEILSYKNVKTETISKGRAMILDKFIENDKKKVSDLLEFLVAAEDDDYRSFYPAEKWLLYYWTQQYQQVLNDVNDSAVNITINTRIEPPKDMMLIKIREKLFLQRTGIKQQIAQSAFNEMEKAFLSLNFYYLLRSYNRNEITQDSLNRLSNEYFRANPRSRYDRYVRKHIRYEFVPAKWGLGAEFFSGYGIFTDNLKKNFNNTIPIGIAFDIQYNNFVLYLRDYIGFSRTKDSIPFKGGTWRKDAQVRVYLPEISLGYVTLHTAFLKAAPFIGISSSNISPTEYDIKKYPEYENVELAFTTTYTVGISLDFKIRKLLYPDGFIRIRYAWNKPQFDWKYNGFNGAFHYITIGVGVFNRGIRRRY